MIVFRNNDIFYDENNNEYEKYLYEYLKYSLEFNVFDYNILYDIYMKLKDIKFEESNFYNIVCMISGDDKVITINKSNEFLIRKELFSCFTKIANIIHFSKNEMNSKSHIILKNFICSDEKGNFKKYTYYGLLALEEAISSYISSLLVKSIYDINGYIMHNINYKDVLVKYPSSFLDNNFLEPALVNFCNNCQINFHDFLNSIFKNSNSKKIFNSICNNTLFKNELGKLGYVYLCGLEVQNKTLVNNFEGDPHKYQLLINNDFMKNIK